MTLTESLNARLNEYRYLLLDPLRELSRWNSLRPERLLEHLGADCLRPVMRGDLAWSHVHCPMLVLIASPGESCDETIMRSSEEYALNEALCDKRYVCGWLSSDLAPDDMAKWLSDLCMSIKPEVFIPVFEPLRLELLCATADPALLSARLAAVSQWHLISSSGRQITIMGQKNNSEWWLNWGAEQAQNSVRDIWRLLFAWGETDTPLTDDAVHRATSIWAETEHVGLHHLSDRLCLALNTLTLSVDFTAHFDVQKRLQQAINNPVEDFTQLLQALPDSFWQEMSHV